MLLEGSHSQTGSPQRHYFPKPAPYPPGPQPELSRPEPQSSELGPPYHSCKEPVKAGMRKHLPFPSQDSPQKKSSQAEQLKDGPKKQPKNQSKQQ